MTNSTVVNGTDWIDELMTSVHSYLISHNATNLLSKLLYPKQIALLIYPCPFHKNNQPCECRFGMNVPYTDLTLDPFFQDWIKLWKTRLDDFKSTIFSAYDIPNDHFQRFVYLCSS